LHGIHKKQVPSPIIAFLVVVAEYDLIEMNCSFGLKRIALQLRFGTPGRMLVK